MTSPLVSTGGYEATLGSLSFFLDMRKTIIYIDGFNLYYRLKNTPYKWLNLQKLSEFYLRPKQHDIIKIKYFTAQVKRKSDDTSNITRQNIYLRALKNHSKFENYFWTV